MKTKAASLVLLSIFVWSILFVGIAWADEYVITPDDPGYDPANPMTTTWTDPLAGPWHLVSWSDNGDGVLSPSDWTGWVDPYGIGGGWHIENIDPVTGEMTIRHQSQMPVPEFPLGGVIEIALLAVVIYVGWNFTRNTKQKGPTPQL